ncbi:dsba oxidoreductase [Colletotrichum truncatum]|uniref:Dsba oxidoreductase n=1 Tax=Colletotrichum truncatum TaxID=5467 RepID=A0ACC3ZCK7_COLTU|nr:dsba oxidoreductase [Colletotrichum truncatum]KAF6797797.1 dsba oxidoreductase [Colletotrichum truncatum]
MTVIQIEAVTDLLCPWCYVGKKNLDRAIDIYREMDPSVKFEVDWKPFYLIPALKSSGYDKRVFYKQRFSVSGDYETTFSRISSICSQAGINLDVSGTTGNSRQCHKLIALALHKDRDVQDRLLNAVFRGHFEEGADITDRGFLLAAAAEAGLDENEAASALDSVRAGEIVDGEVLSARKAGVTGVPTFTVQGRWRVGGNQEPDIFLRVFERVADEG